MPSTRISGNQRPPTLLRPGGQAKLRLPASGRLEGGLSDVLTCGGCLLPHEDHSKADYLAIEDLEMSAKLENLDLDAAVELIKAVEVAKQEPDQ